MPRTTVAPLPHDQAVVAALETIGKPVGYAKAPEGALDGVLTASGPDYLVLWPTSSTRSGSMGDPYSDAVFTYRLHAVGRDAAGVRWLVGQVEPTLLGITVAGRWVSLVEVIDDGGATEDMNVGPPHPSIATPVIRLHTNPA